MIINHINIMDGDGKVYCKKENKIIKLDFDNCSSCNMFNGSAQGEGVECLWKDERTTEAFMRIDVPELELEWLSGVTRKSNKSSFSKNEQSFNELLDRIHRKMQEDDTKSGEE